MGSRGQQQTWTIDKSDLLNSLGPEDLSEISASRNPKLVQSYKLRRLKIAELEGRIKTLLDRTEITPKLRKTITDLSRELKSVVLTDPTEAFKFDPNSKKGVKLGDTKYTGWKYTIPDWYTAKDPFQAHHKAGLDKYFRGVLGKSDADLFFMHQDLAKEGVYLANHPKNRLNIHRSLHQGSTRRGGAVRQSVHGVLDWSELDSDDFNALMNEVDPRDWRTNFDIDTGIGSKASTYKGLKRVPTPEVTEIGYSTDQILNLAKNDYTIADRVSQVIPEELPLWDRNISKQGGLKAFVEKYPNPLEWPEGTREILKSGDVKALSQLSDKIEARKNVETQRKFLEVFGENSVTRKKLAEAAEAYQKLPTPLKFGSGLLLADLAFSTLDIHAGGVQAEQEKGDTLESKYRQAAGRLRQTSGALGLGGAGTSIMTNALKGQAIKQGIPLQPKGLSTKIPTTGQLIKGGNLLSSVAGLSSVFTGLTAWRAEHLADQEARRTRDQKILTGEIQTFTPDDLEIKKTEPRIPNLPYLK